MKETIKTSRTAGYLEKIFRALNADWFGGELEEPIITIQSTPRAYGHVTVAKVWKRKDQQRHELNIGAETLERPIEEVVSTIMHEAVHLYNLAHGVQDCSRGGSYHNKRFKEEAERRGLYHFSHVFSGRGLRDKVLNSFQRGGQKIRFVPPAMKGTKKYSSQISLVISLIPTRRPISLRLIKKGSREGLMR